MNNSEAAKEDVARHKERDKMLMQTIREVQEVKKMLAASQEKKWYEFWSRIPQKWGVFLLEASGFEPPGY